MLLVKLNFPLVYYVQLAITDVIYFCFIYFFFKKYLEENRL